MKKLASLIMVAVVMTIFLSSASGQRKNEALYQITPNQSIKSQLDPEYRSYLEVYDFLDSIVSLYPDIVTMDTSWTSQFEEFKIPVLKISDNPELEEDEPAIGYDGLIHSREPVSMETCLKLIEYLLSNYDSDPQVTEWINNTEIFIIPMLNPEGWNYVYNDWDNNFAWYKNLHDNDTNGVFNPAFDGVNLNRNFDSNWQYGNPNPSNKRYRGAYPFSEKETQLKRKYASEQKYILSINYHSAPGSYEFTESVGAIETYLNQPNPEFEIIKRIADSIAYRTPRLNNPHDHYLTALYNCDVGYSDCWMIEKNGTLEFGIETAPELYPSGPDALQVAEDNAMAGLYLLNRVFGPGITGHVHDDNGDPIVVTVKVLELDTTWYYLEPKTSDSLYGRFFRMLNPGTYTVEVTHNNVVLDTYENVLVTEDTLTYLDMLVSVEELVSEDQYKPVIAYPNPFSTSTIIEYELNEPETVRIIFYNQFGKQVDIIENSQPKGINHFVWYPEILPAGVYYFRLSTGRLQAGEQVTTGKVVKISD